MERVVFMRKLFITLLASSLLFCLSSCGEKHSLGWYEYSEKNSISSITSTVDIVENTKNSPSDNQVLSEIESMGETYQNPIMDHTFEHAGQFGDPYVLRWNGMYYLYPSPNGDYGVQCWVSENLVDWTFTGFCTVDDIFKGAWAPEVEYYNGKFYMTTTGYAGEGDYILVSDSPTGPFTIAAKDLETNFDSNIFVDDDGSWYLFYPNGDDIWVVDMTSPTTPLKSTYTMLKVTVAEDAWTEGPMVIKYKDTYFLTFCGGEVENPGYQIHYATSDGDLRKFTRGENYPILINTDLSTYPGLGHSSMVTGPNLDSLYKVYHSMPWRSQPRTLMIDPLYINGNYMQALGPTLTAQQAPEMPDIYSRFDSEESLEGWVTVNAEIIDSKLSLSEGGLVLSEKGVEGDFTAEYNFLSIEDVYANDVAFIPALGKAGMIFDYTDENNYGAAYINTVNSVLEIVFTVDGNATVYKEILRASFEDYVDYSVLQKFTIKKEGNVYRFLFNDKTLCDYESTLSGGAIGVSCLSGSATVGFVGAEGNVWHSSYKELYKPVEGEFGALLCVENGLNTVEYDKKEYLSVKSGETYNYYINAEADGNYDIALKYRSEESFSFDLYLNGVLVYQGEAFAAESNRTEVIRGLNLSQGYGVFTLKVTGGSADIFNYKFITSTNVTESIRFDLSTPLYSEREWGVDNGSFTASSVGKFLYGNREWDNYSVKAVFEPSGDSLTAHMLLRVTNESLSPKHTINQCRKYYIGYYVEVVNKGSYEYVALFKQNYGETELVRCDIAIPDGTSVEITAEVIDELIRVYLNGELVLEYSDPEPYLKGAVGFSNILSARVSELTVEPIE